MKRLALYRPFVEWEWFPRGMAWMNMGLVLANAPGLYLPRIPALAWFSVLFALAMFMYLTFVMVPRTDAIAARINKLRRQIARLEGRGEFLVLVLALAVGCGGCVAPECLVEMEQANHDLRMCLVNQGRIAAALERQATCSDESITINDMVVRCRDGSRPVRGACPDVTPPARPENPRVAP